MKTAIVGLGVIGKVHKQIIESQGYDLVAICDVDPERKEISGQANFYGDYIEMLEKEKPDVVHICTPHYLHAQMVVEALNRNINVLCEKPLCISEEEITKVLKAEEKSSAILGVCHQNRYVAPNLFAKNYLSDKEILGASGLVLWSRNNNYYQQAEWRGKWATEGGGVLINQALHTFDLLQWICGMPESLISGSENFTHGGVIEVEDTVNAFCFGDVNFSFFATTSNPVSMPVEMVFKTKEQVIKVYPNSVLLNTELKLFDKMDYYFGKPCYGSGHLNLIIDFYDCVKNGKRFDIDGKEASKVVKMILAVYKSKGEKIKI